MLKRSWILIIVMVVGVAGIISLALAPLASPLARAAGCTMTVTVQNSNDSGPGSLRQALADVCPGGVITFAGNGTIFLHSPLSLNSRLTVDGSGHAITVSGDTWNDGSGDVQVFNVGASGVVTLVHLNIVSGRVTLIISGTMPYLPPGGGVYVGAGGQLTVTDCAFIGNSAMGEGGGLYNAGALTVRNSTFLSNSAVIGSGLYNDGVLNLEGSSFFSNTVGIAGSLYNAGASTVQTSTFSGNSGIQGGALYNAGVLTLTASLVYNHSVPDLGGGLYNSGALAVQSSAIVSNSARSGGGLYNSGSLTVTTSTFSGNASGYGGGGIENEGNLRVVSSLFSGNAAGYGGGLANAGPSTVLSSTFSGNSAGSGEGGGIQSQSALTVTGCTISGNSAGIGGGLINGGGSPLIMLNSTVYSNTAQVGGGIISFGVFTATNCTLSGNSAEPGEGGGFYNGDGAAVFINSLLVHSPSGGDCGYQAGTVDIYYSLIESTGGDACYLPDFVNGTRVGQNPLLDDLRDNGGPTWTCALLAGSPAIDPVNSAACLAADQRGAPRPLDGNADGTAACDIGAYEAYAPSTTFRITVTTAGAGTGQVLVQPAGSVFSPMTVITLTAVPDLGSSFTGWSGDVNGMDNPLTMIMLSGDKIITAHFAEIKRLYLPVVRR